MLNLSEHPLRHSSIFFRLTERDSGRTLEIPISILLKTDPLCCLLYKDGEIQFTLAEALEHLMRIARRNNPKEISLFRFIGGLDWHRSFLLYLALFRFEKAYLDNKELNRDNLIGMIRRVLNKDIGYASAYGRICLSAEISTTTFRSESTNFNVSIKIEGRDIYIALERLLCRVDERTNVGPFGENKLTELGATIEPILGLDRNPLTSPPDSKIDNIWSFIRWLNPQR